MKIQTFGLLRNRKFHSLLNDTSSDHNKKERYHGFADNRRSNRGGPCRDNHLGGSQKDRHSDPHALCDARNSSHPRSLSHLCRRSRPEPDACRLLRLSGGARHESEDKFRKGEKRKRSDGRIPAVRSPAGLHHLSEKRGL